MIVAGATAAWRFRDPGPAPVRSLLILPFQSVNSVGDDLGQGISEQVTARLAALPELRLISPAAAHRIKSEGISPQEAGQRLKVEAVLTGSVRKAGQKIRVNAQVIRSADGQVVWAEGGLDVAGTDLLEAERLVADAIATRLRRSLTASERSAISRPLTFSPEAYELFVRGRLALRKAREADDILVAQKLLEQATRVDPEFAEAYAWLAIAQYARFSRGTAGDEVRKASLANARRALEIDPSTTAARRALITIFHSTGQAEEGLQEAAVLRQARVNDKDSFAAIAEAYLRAGMPDRAIPLLQQAMELDPEDTRLPASLSFAAYWARQYDLGLRATRAGRAILPHAKCPRVGPPSGGASGG